MFLLQGPERTEPGERAAIEQVVAVDEPVVLQEPCDFQAAVVGGRAASLIPGRQHQERLDDTVNVVAVPLRTQAGAVDQAGNARVRGSQLQAFPIRPQQGEAGGRQGVST